MANKITKEEILEYLELGKPVRVDFEDLRFQFGFVRVDTSAILLNMMVRPSKTEEELSYLPDYKIRENIINWAHENELMVIEGIRMVNFGDYYEFGMSKEYLKKEKEIRTGVWVMFKAAELKNNDVHEIYIKAFVMQCDYVGRLATVNYLDPSDNHTCIRVFKFEDLILIEPDDKLCDATGVPKEQKDD